MKKIILNYVECHNSGQTGLLIEGAKPYQLTVATDGMLAAHDILEHHTPGCIGGVADELEALGAMWWMRGVFNDINRHAHSPYSPYENLSHDVELMAEQIYCGVSTVPDPLVTYACDYDDDFKLIIEMAHKRFKKMMLNDIHTDMFRGVSEANRYFDTASHYMRVGYRRAVKRYKNLGQIGANALFWDTVKAIDSQLNYIDIGEQLEVRYNLSVRDDVKVSIKRDSGY